MGSPVRGTSIIPEHYSVGGGDMAYYALVFEDLELFTSPTDEVHIDLSPYKRIHDDPRKNGSILNGKQWRSCPIPCIRVDEPASVLRTEPVIARAKLIEPYAVELRPSPF